MVICAYSADRWDLMLAAVFAATYGQEHSPREVILVIDHNGPLLERARRELPSISVIANREAPGLSGARNTGIRAASGRVVAFLDDDAAAARSWLGGLADAYESDLVAGVGGAAIATWESGRPGWFPSEFDWVVGCSYRGMPRRRSVVRNPIGCNMSFRRDLLMAVGGFRSEVGRVGSRPTGGDETELSIRMLQRFPGLEILYEPKARVRHHVPAQRATWRYFRSRCFSEGLSKAVVTRLVGSRQALAVERRYVRRVLPSGVSGGLIASLRGERMGALRAAAIVAGLAITSGGYVYGMLTRARLVPVVAGGSRR